MERSRIEPTFKFTQPFPHSLIIIFFNCLRFTLARPPTHATAPACTARLLSLRVPHGWFDDIGTWEWLWMCAEILCWICHRSADYTQSLSSKRLLRFPWQWTGYNPDMRSRPTAWCWVVPSREWRLPLPQPLWEWSSFPCPAHAAFALFRLHKSGESLLMELVKN